MEIDTTHLTEKELARLNRIAEKAKQRRRVKLTRKEIHRIEDGFSDGNVRLMIVKRGDNAVRVFSPKGHAKICQSLREYHAKKKATKTA